jgi:hypothetical protein
MSNNRPTYQSSVAIEPIPQVSGEGAASELINTFQNFSNTVSGVSQSISKNEATTQRSIIKNNISTSYKQFALQALAIPDQNQGLDHYNKLSKEYSKQLVGESSGHNHEYISNLTDYYHNQYITEIEKNAILQNKRRVQVDAYENMNQANIDVVNAIQNAEPLYAEDKDGNMQNHTYDNAMALMADSIKNMRQQAQLTNIQPERVAEAERQLYNLFTRNVYLKEYKNAVSENRGDEYIESLQDPNTSLVNFQGKTIEEREKHAIIGQMLAIRNNHLLASKGAISVLKTDITKEIDRITKTGGMENEDLTNRARQAGEQYANDLEQKRAMAQTAYQAREFSRTASPSEIKQHLDDLKPSADDPEYDKKMTVYNYAVQAVQKQDKEFRNNPMEQILQNSDIQQQVNDYEQAFNADAVGSDDKNYTPFNSTVAKPWDNIIKMQQHRGLTLNGKENGGVRLLDNAKVSEIINDINNSNGQQKVVLINKLNDEYGGLPFNLVMKQLVSKGLNPGLAMLRNIDPNSPDAMDVGNAFSMPAAALSAEIKKLNPEAHKDIPQKANQDAFGISEGTPNFKSFLTSINTDADGMKNIANTVTHLSNYYLMTGKASDAATAITKAENVVAGRYDYTLLNNHPIRIPKTYPDKAVIDALKDSKKLVESYPWHINANVNRDDAMELISNGFWRNDNVDHGVVWADANGRIWSDGNGHPLSKSFDEMAEPNTGPLKPSKPLPEGEIQSIETGTNNQLENIDKIGQKKLDNIRHRRENMGLIDTLKKIDAEEKAKGR